MRFRTIPLTLLAGALALGLVGCADGGSSPSPEEGDPNDDGHGKVAGAAELAEPPLGLTTIDGEGRVTHLDLLDESVTEIGEIAPPTAVHTDGRYLFAQTDAGIEIIDSGVWTWDHVDHFHYYRADARLLGLVPGEGTATIATSNLSTSGGTGLFFSSGDAVLIDTAALSKGTIAESFRLQTEPHEGMVVPVGSFALVTEPEHGTAARVVGYTGDGEPTGLEEACLDASGTITTRVGAVIGCRDGALLATVEDGQLRVERVPYPAGTTAPAARAFANREGRPTVAGLAGAAGEAGIWMFDSRERTWTLLPAPGPLMWATAVDDDADHVLALDADGRVLVLDGADGEVLARTEPLVAASLGNESSARWAAPVLIADQQRAYLSAPAERRLYEIDFADGARIARTFETPTPPAFTAETGR
jgi:hypothetical protein